MSRIAILRCFSAALLALTYGFLVQASERLERSPSAPVVAGPQPPPRHDAELDAFVRETDAAIGRLEKEADAPSPAAPPPISEEAAVAKLYGAETRSMVRAGVMATFPDRLERLTRELGLAPDEIAPVRAALARVTDTLADRWGARVAEALASAAPPSPDPLEAWARSALRAELARVLGPDRMALYDAGTCFREEGEGR